MDGRAFEGLDKLFRAMAIALAIFIPLGMWKIFELVASLITKLSE